jgi:hypothetical protein
MGSADVVGMVVVVVVVVVVVDGSVTAVEGELVDEPDPWAAAADPGATSKPSTVNRHREAAANRGNVPAFVDRLSVTDVTCSTLRSLPGAVRWPRWA